MKAKATEFIFFIIGLMVLAGACQEKDTGEHEPVIGIALQEIPENPDYASLPLIGTKWKLIGFADSKIQTIKLAEPSEGDTFTLKFEADGTLGGVTSTNQVTGTYDLDGHELQITVWGGTKINELFDGPLYVRAIEQVHTFQLSSKGLMLHYEPHKYLLFKPFD